MPTRRLSPEGGLTRGSVSARTLGPEGGELWGVPHRLEKGTSVSEDVVLRRGWIVRSHIVGEENEAFFIRVWKPFSSRHVLKTLRGSPKGKAQREQYLLVVGLGCYKWYQSQTPSHVPARRLSPEGGLT